MSKLPVSKLLVSKLLVSKLLVSKLLVSKLSVSKLLAKLGSLSTLGSRIVAPAPPKSLPEIPSPTGTESGSSNVKSRFSSYSSSSSSLSSSSSFRAKAPPATAAPPKTAAPPTKPAVRKSKFRSSISGSSKSVDSNSGKSGSLTLT